MDKLRFACVLAVLSLLAAHLGSCLHAQTNLLRSRYDDFSDWPILPYSLGWPGLSAGAVASGASFGVNPAIVVLAQRARTELGYLQGWHSSRLWSLTQVLSARKTAAGAQFSLEEKGLPFSSEPNYAGSVSIGYAVGVASGVGIGISFFDNRTTRKKHLRLSGGFVSRVGPIRVGGSILNAQYWMSGQSTYRPLRLIWTGATIELSRWLEVGADARALLRWQPKAGSERPWSFIARRLRWASGERLSAGVIVRPIEEVEVVMRRDLDGKLLAGGLKLDFGSFGATFAAASYAATGLGGFTQRGRKSTVSISVFHKFGLERRRKLVKWQVDKARQFLKKGDVVAARKSLETALSIEPSDSNALQMRKLLGGVETRKPTTIESAPKAARTSRGKPTLSGSEIVRSLKVLDSLRQAYVEKLGQSSPVIDSETLNWHSEPVNLGPAVNSHWNDFSPSVTVDGQQLFFTSNRLGGLGIVHELDGRVHGSEDFWVSSKVSGQWTEAQNLGRPINTVGSEGAPCISADGQKIYFVKCSDPEGYGHCDIYVAELHGREWKAPRNLGPAVNTAFWEAHPSISSDGRVLYFAREDTTGTNIWYSVYSDTGWTIAMKLGSEINSPFDEVSPFIHADGKTLYFASNRPGGYGGFDLYVSRWDGNKWTEAKNLGPWINTEGDDKYLSIPGAGDKAFFASSKMGGLGGLDIYEVELPPAMRPNPVTTVRGKVLNALSGKPVEAEIHLRSLETGKDVAVTRSNAATGEYLVVLPSARIYSVLARATGFVDYTERYEIGIQDAYREVEKDFLIHPAKVVRRIRRRILDSQTGRPIPVLIQVKRLSDGEVIGQAYADINTGEVVVDVPIDGEYGLFYQAPGYAPFSEHLAGAAAGSDTTAILKLTRLERGKEVVFPVNLIFFDFDSDHLRKESTAELLQAVEFLRENPELRVEIQGHTDDKGSEEYNLELSKRRAEAVKRFLQDHGINPSRLLAKGYGETMPRFPNTSEENRAKNRRVEFKILVSKNEGE